MKKSDVDFAKKCHAVLLLCVCILFYLHSQAQNTGVAINMNETPSDPSAILDVASSTQGVLIPRMTQEERDAIVNPATGLQIYNTNTNCINLWNGISWRQSCFDCEFTPPTVGNNGPLCEGDYLQLSASAIPNAIYSWAGPGGFHSDEQNPSLSNITLSSNGGFSLTVTLNGCSSSTITTFVTVNANPATPIVGSNSPVCAGDIISLTASAIPGAAYSWSGPNGFTSNQQYPSITNAGVINSGEYHVVATVNGCVGEPGYVTVAVGNNPGSFSQTYTAHFENNNNTNVSTENDEVKLLTAIDFGTGIDGAYVANSNTDLVSGTYQFSSFTINQGITVRVTGNEPLQIKCTGDVIVNGILKLNGGDGMSGRRMTDGFGCGNYNYPNAAGASANPSGGSGGPGGYSGANGQSGGNGLNGNGPGGGNGGNSVNGGGGGGGFGSNGSNGTGGGGTGGSMYGDNQLTLLQGGSGGGAGAGYTANLNDGGAGGGGGGAVKITAPSISLNSNGAILANGGGGGGGDGAGGGGSGGAIWLVANMLSNDGLLQAIGGVGGCATPYSNPGGNGGNGRIRLDYADATLGGTITPSGYVGTIDFSVSPGSTVTALIAPENLCHWGTLNYTATVPSGTHFSVNILDSSDQVLASDVMPGADLSNIPNVAAANAIKLQAAFSTTNGAETPTLDDWSVSYMTQ